MAASRCNSCSSMDAAWVGATMCSKCAPTEVEPRWHWRNTRDVSIAARFSPLNWRLSMEVVSDFDLFEAKLSLGPFHFEGLFDIGVPDVTLFHLSFVTAFERACVWEGLGRG